MQTPKQSLEDQPAEALTVCLAQAWQETRVRLRQLCARIGQSSRSNDVRQLGPALQHREQAVQEKFQSRQAVADKGQLEARASWLATRG